MANVVSNTGPLIALAQIGQFNLLQALFEQVVIPPAVRAEIQDDVSRAALTAAEWLVVSPPADLLAVQLLLEELDAGESEALILAKEKSAKLLLIDERAAARKARTLGLSVIGTLGILLLGQKAGYLTTLKPHLEHLQQTGFRMSTSLYTQVLLAAGESE